MIKIVGSTIILCISILMLSSIEWFQAENIKIEKINKEHINDIHRLKEVSKINTWIKNSVLPSFEILPKDKETAQNALVDFFDLYGKYLGFKIDKFIYPAKKSYNIDIKSSVFLYDIEALQEMISLKYDKGFLLFRGLRKIQDKAIGDIEVIQPCWRENNASN